MTYAQRNPYPLTCFQGEDRAFILSLKKKDGSIYNLTNCVVKSEMHAADSTLIANLNPQIVDAIQGKIKLTITATDSLIAGKHYYDVRVQSPFGIDYVDPSSFTIMATVSK